MASQQLVRSGEPMELQAPLQAPPWSAEELREMRVFMSIDNRTEHCNFSFAGHMNWYGSVQGGYPANISPWGDISRIKHNPAPPNGPSNGGVLYTTDISGTKHGFVLAWYFPNDNGRSSNKVYVRGGGSPEQLTEDYWNEIRGLVCRSDNNPYIDSNEFFKFTASVNERGSPAIITLTLEINAEGKKVTYERELKKA